MTDDDEAITTEEANELANEIIEAMARLIEHGYSRADLEAMIDSAEMNV